MVRPEAAAQTTRQSTQSRKCEKMGHALGMHVERASDFGETRDVPAETQFGWPRGAQLTQ